MRIYAEHFIAVACFILGVAMLFTSVWWMGIFILFVDIGWVAISIARARR